MHTPVHGCGRRKLGDAVNLTTSVIFQDRTEEKRQKIKFNMSRTRTIRAEEMELSNKRREKEEELSQCVELYL